MTDAERAERDILSMTEAIFAERCPGIAFLDEDRPFYRAAAIAALLALGVLPAGHVDPPAERRPRITDPLGDDGISEFVATASRLRGGPPR